ncbi:DUF1579 domain-containing protein [Mangrovimonas sp. DI 80]|uniref:DUF1579 domain-containing protein n=1 Tax=Mangrovimonas sp. DI 80 TaxID=1779330 RepID=UPI0009786BB8|nr:DUF1579 domain-containing protein [Mangrovimonas sp. DI 80]OMP30854.1 hypothetical protein BKM32_11560 [Mangrovimonas sp. DI 80]
MKRVFLGIICFLLTVPIWSQTPEEMKAWQDNMTPGAPHKFLASMDGNWDATVKMWMDPSQPANISKAYTVNEMIMNGLYQRSTHKGEMMGTPFLGESIIGYDNAKKKFVSSWIDNMGSGIMYMEGDYDPDKKILTLEGSMIDPATGKDTWIREVLTYNNNDSHTFEMFVLKDGKQIKNMEIVYTRSK